ncbi:amidase [Leptospira vanthielii]|uniref:Amidase n=1 Tax=Leptospira vanthielii TaxID=293085 RepID=A0ABY2NTM5_9LEPT|nr:amidase [Leptospira vanthielii]TGM60685.1 amidase [Leptospira vanthielii]
MNLEYSIPEINELLLKKEIQPIDLINNLEENIKKYEHKVHAWVHTDIENLRSEINIKNDLLQERINHSKLTYIPVGIKDIFNTKVFPTEMGSLTWKDFTPGNNARVVDLLIQEGALIAGKTVTAEFAVHELNETINPHDFTRTPGTSSSGSAVSVSTGMVPYALGTQTAGSIIRPASFCGIWGMKPSFGLIPRTGVLKTADSLDTVGFLASHGKSLRPILDTIRMKGPDYPYIYKHIDSKSEYPKTKDKVWKIGFVRTHTWESAEPYAKDSFLEFINQLSNQKSLHVNEVEWKESISESHTIHEKIYNKSLSYYFQNEEKAGEHISKIMRNMIELGKDISPSQYKDALRKQEYIAKEVDAMLESYDVVFSLGTASHAPLRGVEEIPDPCLIWTLSHVPSIAIPLYRSPSGLPIGIQAISRRFNDYLLLQLIEEFIDNGIFPKGSMRINNSAL